MAAGRTGGGLPVFDMLGWTHLIHTHITAGVRGKRTDT